MSKSNTFENDLVKLIFQAETIPDFAQALSGGSVLEISLHTANPDETGNQSTSEIAYTNYARVAVARTASGWTVSNNQASNAAAINFPQCGASGGTATYFGVGTNHTGTGKLLYSGQLTAQLVISEGITPSFAIGALTVTED